MVKDYSEMLLELLNRQDWVSVEEACERFQVSPATVRRIFNRIAESGSARRVRGGLRRFKSFTAASIPLQLRDLQNSRAKAAIAATAAGLLPPEGTSFIHGGSTTAFLAAHVKSGTVVTNSAGICEMLRRKFPQGGVEVLMIGGNYDLRAGITAGGRAEEMIREFRAEAMFFSTRGMDESGILDSNITTAMSIRRMAENSVRRILLADHSKFRSSGMSRALPWSSIDTLITDDFPETLPFCREIEKHRVEVIRV